MNFLAELYHGLFTWKGELTRLQFLWRAVLLELTSMVVATNVFGYAYRTYHRFYAIPNDLMITIIGLLVFLFATFLSVTIRRANTIGLRRVTAILAGTILVMVAGTLGRFIIYFFLFIVPAGFFSKDKAQERPSLVRTWLDEFKGLSVFEGDFHLKLLKLAIILNCIAVIDLLRYAFRFGDRAVLFTGLFFAAIGVNTSLLSPPCFIGFLLSLIGGFFFSLRALALGIAIIAAWTAYCLIAQWMYFRR